MQGQMTIYDFPMFLPAKEVEVKGIMDDGYCPSCDACLNDLVEECPYCGQKLLWNRWKILNDYQPQEELSMTDKELLRGSGFENGKQRIKEYFEKCTNLKDRADFLKKEYGVGGWSMDKGFVSCNSNGLHFQGITSTIHMSWQQVQERINYLIERGVY